MYIKTFFSIMLSALAYGYIFPIYLNMINLPLGVSLLYLGATFAIFYVLLSAMSDFSKNSHANFFPSFAGAALQAFKLTASPGLVYSFYAYFSSVSAFFLSLTLALQVAAAAASILLVWGLLSHLETLVKSAVDFKKTSQSSAEVRAHFGPYNLSPLPISSRSSNEISDESVRKNAQKKSGLHPGSESVGQTNSIGSGPILGTSDDNDLKDRSGGDQPGEKMKNVISDVNSSPFSGSYSTSLSPSESPKINAQQLPLDTSIGSPPSIHSSMNLTSGDIQIAEGKAESKLDPNRSQGEINDLIEWANTQVDSLSNGTLKSVEQENIKKLKSALDANPGITDNMDLRDFIEIFSQLIKFDSDLDELDENKINERISQFKSWCESIERNQQTYATFINRVDLDLIHGFVSCQQNELKTHGDEMAEIQLFKNYTPQDFWDNLRDLLVGERDLSHLQCAVSLECVKYCAENLNQEAVKSPNTFQASSYLNDKTKSFLLPCASKFLYLGMLNQSDLKKFPFDFQKSVSERSKVAADVAQLLFGDKRPKALNEEKAALLSSQFNSLDEVSPFANEISGVELANNSSQINQAAVGTYFKLLKKLNHYPEKGMLDECKKFGISIMQLINIHFCNADPGLYEIVLRNLRQYFAAIAFEILDESARKASLENLAAENPVGALLEFINRGNEYAAAALLGKLYGRTRTCDFLDFSSCNDSLERAKVYLMAAKMGFITDQIGQLLNNSENLFREKNPSDLQKFAQFLKDLLDDNQPGDDPICKQWNDSLQPVGALKDRVQLLGACLKLKLGAGCLEPTKLTGIECANRSTSVNSNSQKLLDLISPEHEADKDNSSAHEDNPSPVTQDIPDRSDDELWAVLTGVNNAQVNLEVFRQFKIGKIAIPSKLMGYVNESSSFSEGQKSKVQQWYDKKLKAPQDTLPQSYGKENIFSR